MILEGEPSDMSVAATRDLTPGFERDIVMRRPTFWTSEVFLGGESSSGSTNQRTPWRRSTASGCFCGCDLTGWLRQDLSGRSTHRDGPREVSGRCSRI